LVQLFSVASEGISHSSHLMLAAAEKGDTKTVIDYITVTGVPMNVKNNYGVRYVEKLCIVVFFAQSEPFFISSLPY